MGESVKLPCEICGMDAEYGYFRCQEHKVMGGAGRKGLPDIQNVGCTIKPQQVGPNDPKCPSCGWSLSGDGKCYIVKCSAFAGDKKETAKIHGANSVQVGGEHYRKHGATGEQHWDRIIRLYPEHAHVYFVAVITKYVERYRDKNGIQDLEKAIHYTQKLIEFEKSRETVNPTNPYLERRITRGPDVKVPFVEDPPYSLKEFVSKFWPDGGVKLSEKQEELIKSVVEGNELQYAVKAANLLGKPSFGVDLGHGPDKSVEQAYQVCPTCHNKSVHGYECTVCKGVGYVPYHDPVERVKFPAMTKQDVEKMNQITLEHSKKSVTTTPKQVLCTQCEGARRIEGRPCTLCRGWGLVHANE